MDDKLISYRATILRQKLGLSEEDAVAMAVEENAKQEGLLKTAKKEMYRERGKNKSKQRKKAKKTVYTVGGKVVTHFVSGGSPSLGKKS